MICAAMLSTIVIYGAGYRCRGALSVTTVSHVILQLTESGRGERVTANC
jgi:hypothetical protein